MSKLSAYNLGEIGAVLRVNAGENISTATLAIIRAEPEVGYAKEFTAIVPNVDVTLDNGEVYSANEYAEYTTTSKDDQDYAGRWRMKLEATFSSTQISQSDYVKYRVLP